MYYYMNKLRFHAMNIIKLIIFFPLGPEYADNWIARNTRQKGT